MPKFSPKQWLIILSICGIFLIPHLAWKLGRSEVRFIRAVRAGKLETVKKMLQANRRLLLARDDHHRAGALQWSVVENQKPVFLFLLEEKTDVNAGDRSGMTPLHSAAIFNRAEMARILISHGAALDAKALFYGSLRLTPLHKAAELGSLETVEVLLEAGLDPNIRTEGANNVTPLHIAAARGKNDVIRLLVEKGADLGALDLVGTTPLDWAVNMERDETAALLRLLAAH